MKKITVVGLGPGERAQMTPKAAQALDESDLIIGYDTYIDLIRQDFAHKPLAGTGMRREIQRCQLAVDEACKGQRVAVVSSGDAGIYGMAGLIYELAQKAEDTLEIEVVAGVTAASGGAALLGAPLSNDFAVVSLSDLLTPWAAIEQRLSCAAQGDFVICLYNPGSQKRSDHLARACEIIGRYRPPQTVCGLVRQIGREGEQATVLSLAQLAETAVDMLTTVFIGNSQTHCLDGKMVTLRGYRHE